MGDPRLGPGGRVTPSRSSGGGSSGGTGGSATSSNTGLNDAVLRGRLRNAGVSDAEIARILALPQGRREGAANTAIETAKAGPTTTPADVRGGRDAAGRLERDFIDEVAQTNPGYVSGESRPTPAAAAPEPAPYDPNAPDILSQWNERWWEDANPIFERAISDVGGYADELSGIGKGYGDALRASEGYSGLQDYAAEMRGIYDQGGLTDVTRSALEANRRAEDQWIRSQRESMLQDLAERGVAGGGYEVAAAIGDRASAADRMSARDLETQAFAQQQALDALTQSSQAKEKILGVDTDIASTQAGYNEAGSSAKYDVASYIRDAALSSWNGIFKNGLEMSQAGWTGAADGAASASEFVSTFLGDQGERGRNNVAGTVGIGTAELEGDIAGKAGAIGTGDPTLSTTGTYVPPENPASVTPVIQGAEAGIRGLASLFGGDEEDDK